jgi:large subunit ribosomal protein L35
MAKNKIKTNRSAAKRFYKVTAKGKVKRARGGKSHLNVKKRTKRKRRLRSADYLEKAEARRVRKVVPYI